MTISSTTTQTLTTCNGTTTNFAFANKIFGASDLVATLIDTSGNLYAFTASGVNTFTNAATGLSYTVYNIDVDAGCFIVFSAAPTNLWQLDLRTAIAELQSTSIKNQASFYPELHEEFFDRITREMQDLRRLTYTYGIHGPDTESTAWTQLPNAKTRANLLLGFDSNGLPTTATSVSQALTQSLIGQFLYPQTAAEIAASVTPTYYFYPPGNAKRYGAAGNSTTDDSTALQASISQCAQGGAPAYWPVGTYKHTVGLTAGSGTGVYIQGDGVGLTNLAPNGSLSVALTFTGVSQGFKDLSILCANASSVTAVSVNGVNGFLADRFLIQQANIGMLFYNGVIADVTNWQINRSISYGIQITGSGVSGGNDQYFHNGIMSNVGYYQAVVGINIQASGGVWLSNLDIISQGIGLLLDPGTGQSVDWLFAVNVALDTCSTGGLVVEPSGTGTVYGCDFTASWVASCSGFGVNLSPIGGSSVISGFRMNGVRVQNNQQHGVVFAAVGATQLQNTNISNCDISGNGAPIPLWNSGTAYSPGNLVYYPTTANYYQCLANSTGNQPPNATYWQAFTPIVYDGVLVGAGASSFTLSANRIGAEDGYTQTQGYGIFISAGASNNYSIVGNDVRGNATAGISDGGTGTTKIVHSNLGVSPPGSTAITVGASPFSYANNTGAPIAVHVSGGTVSSITIETQGIGSAVTSGQFVVPQGASITVTYSVAPTMVTYGLL